MAFNKKQKQDMLAQYEEWLRNSQAVYLMSFDHMSMSEIDTLRAQVREAGGTARIVKNTILQKALQSLEMEIQDDSLVGTTLAGFAFEDAPALAKAFYRCNQIRSFFNKVWLSRWSNCRRRTDQSPGIFAPAACYACHAAQHYSGPRNETRAYPGRTCPFSGSSYQSLLRKRRRCLIIANLPSWSVNKSRWPQGLQK